MFRIAGYRNSWMMMVEIMSIKWKRPVNVQDYKLSQLLVSVPPRRTALHNIDKPFSLNEAIVGHGLRSHLDLGFLFSGNGREGF